MKKRRENQKVVKKKIDAPAEEGRSQAEKKAAIDRFLSIKEVAKIFGMHEKTIRRWATRQNNKLVGSKPGGKWIFRWVVVQKFADDNEVGM